jgi:hypothetical protein
VSGIASFWLRLDAHSQSLAKVKCNILVRRPVEAESNFENIDVKLWTSPKNLTSYLKSEIEKIVPFKQDAEPAQNLTRSNYGF